MKFPKLVVNPQTAAFVNIESNKTDEYGGHESVLSAELKCNFQAASNIEYKTDRQPINITAKAYFDGDICPDLPFITSGKVKIYSYEYQIYRGTKARNIDGSVNYTLLELI